MTVYYNEFDKKAAAWLRQLIKNGDIAEGIVDERSITEVEVSDLRGFRQYHFFAGVAGWSFALRNAGWSDDRPVWTASLPCQPFSVAGNQKGKKDERHLLPHFIELVKQFKPKTIFGEQVASSEVVGSKLEADFIIAVQQNQFATANKLAKRLVAQRNFSYTSRWIDDLQSEMEEDDYAFRFEILGAHSVNKAHQRQRVYWVASSWLGNSESERQERQCAKVDKSQRAAGGHGVECGYCGLADTQHQGSEGRVLRGKNSEREVINRHLGCDGSDSGMGDSERDGHTANQVGRSVSEGEEKSRLLKHKGSDSESIEWLYCRDEKYRPIKKGINPLVQTVKSSTAEVANGSAGVVVPGRDTIIAPNDSSEARAIRIKGYGNAIVAPVAEAFIKAFMGTINE